MLSKEEADKNNSEAWVICFFCKLYKSKSVKRLSKNRIDFYKSRVFTDINKRLFEVLLGNNSPNSLSKTEYDRFVRLTGVKNAKS